MKCLDPNYGVPLGLCIDDKLGGAAKLAWSVPTYVCVWEVWHHGCVNVWYIRTHCFGCLCGE